MPLLPTDIPDFLNQALVNLTNKPTAVIGHMIADVLSIPASKIHYWAQKCNLESEQKFIEFTNSVSDKLSLLPADKITTPQIQLLGAISEDIVYCIDYDELRDMFASLLANGCNKDFSSVMHPSFSATIKQMGSYDAQLFNRIYLCPNDQPIVAAEYIVLTHNSSSYLMLHECIVFTDEPFDDFSMQSVSISALKHLGLIDYTISNASTAGEKFECCAYYRELERKYSGSNSYPVVRSVQVYLTPYGRSFALACSIDGINHPTSP